MTNITEHNTEKERESHHCENCRIDFLVVRNTICIDNLLEDPCHIIVSEKGRRLDSMITDNLKLRDLDVSVFILNSLDLSHDSRVVKIRDPAEPNVEATLNLELVQSGIEGLLFYNEHLVNLEDRNGLDISVGIYLILDVRPINDLLNALQVVLKAEAGINN